MCVALLEPFTVMVTFDVPVGVEYFTPLTELEHPLNVIVAPASKKIIDR